jgi:mannose/cellobiose epimerase-like protein (N-acyl-D-glucosamine 2-epimerase family)
MQTQPSEIVACVALNVSASAGHNIEAAWLLADGVDELQARGTIDSSKASAMRKALREIGEAAIAAGYDDTHGGL